MGVRGLTRAECPACGARAVLYPPHKADDKWRMKGAGSQPLPR